MPFFSFKNTHQKDLLRHFQIPSLICCFERRFWAANVLFIQKPLGFELMRVRAMKILAPNQHVKGRDRYLLSPGLQGPGQVDTLLVGT